MMFVAYRLVANVWSITATRPLCRCLSAKLTPDRMVRPDTDRVSPVAHPVSNLRLIYWSQKPNETPIERHLRLKRQELQEWNHEYWLNNNANFQRQKAEYIKRELKTVSDREFKSTLSYDELSLFYKSFLDSNHRKHMNYNLEWYKRHTSLLWPAFRVFLIRLRRTLFSKKN